MLVSFALGDANFLHWPCTFHFLCVDFFALGSKRKPHFQWNIGCIGSLALGLCVGHVHFIFFVLISFASGTQRKPVFLWNMGLRLIYIILKWQFYMCMHPPSLLFERQIVTACLCFSSKESLLFACKTLLCYEHVHFNLRTVLHGLV